MASPDTSTQLIDEYAHHYRQQLNIQLPAKVVKAAIERLQQDKGSSENIIRVMIDNYYALQKYRLIQESRMRAVSQGYDDNVDLPQNNFLSLEMNLMMYEQMEKNAKKFLKYYVESTDIGTWLKSIVGVGDVIAAGLIAYIDIHHTKTAGQIIRYAGLDPTRKWLSKANYGKILNLNKTPVELDPDDHQHEEEEGSERNLLIRDDDLVWYEGMSEEEQFLMFNKIHKVSGWKVTNLVNIWRDIELGETKNSSFSVKTNEFVKHLARCPWNKRLKVLCFLMGQSISKTINNENSVYGRLLLERKAYETIKNEEGDYAEQAAEILRTKTFDKNKSAYKAYSQGKLPAGHIQARAARYACKLLLSHLHQVWRSIEGYEVPEPYAIAHLGHSKPINPPNFDPDKRLILINS